MTAPRGSRPLPRHGWLLIECGKCGLDYPVLRHEARRTTSGMGLCVHCGGRGATHTWGSFWTDDAGELYFVPEGQAGA